MHCYSGKLQTYYSVFLYTVVCHATNGQGSYTIMLRICGLRFDICCFKVDEIGTRIAVYGSFPSALNTYRASLQQCARGATKIHMVKSLTLNPYMSLFNLKLCCAHIGSTIIINCTALIGVVIHMGRRHATRWRTGKRNGPEPAVYLYSRRLNTCERHDYIVPGRTRDDISYSSSGLPFLNSSTYVPTCRRSTVGGRAFPVARAKVWNSLPSDVTSASSLSVLKNSLKT